jgi:hypothetical protein
VCAMKFLNFCLDQDLAISLIVGGITFTEDADEEKTDAKTDILNRRQVSRCRGVRTPVGLLKFMLLPRTAQ